MIQNTLRATSRPKVGDWLDERGPVGRRDLKKRVMKSVRASGRRDLKKALRGGGDI